MPAGAGSRLKSGHRLMLGSVPSALPGMHTHESYPLLLNNWASMLQLLTFFRGHGEAQEGQHTWLRTWLHTACCTCGLR